MLGRIVKTERSQSLVEFALALPVLLLLMLAIIDFGMGFRAYIQLTNATREGARYAVVGNPPGAYPTNCTGTDSGNVVSRVCATAGNLSMSGMENVSVAYPEGQLSGDSVVVSANYRYDLITPVSGILTLVTGGSFPGYFDMTSTTDMRLE